MSIRLVAVGPACGDGTSTVTEPRSRADNSPPDYAGMLAAIVAGDRTAESALMQAITPPLRVVLRRRAPGSEIDDLQQETLLVVLAAARDGRIADPRGMVQFTLETARRLAANAIRKTARHRTGSDDAAIESAISFELGGDELLARETLKRSVHEVLGELRNPRDRQLLYSYYLDEEPSSVLQARFSMTSTQLGRVLHRARQRFGDVWRRMRPGSVDNE